MYIYIYINIYAYYRYMKIRVSFLHKYKCFLLSANMSNTCELCVGYIRSDFSH